MRFVLKLLANLTDPHDGDFSDRAINVLSNARPGGSLGMPYQLGTRADGLACATRSQPAWGVPRKGVQR